MKRRVHPCASRRVSKETSQVSKAFTKESEAADEDDGDGPSLPALPAGTR